MRSGIFSVIILLIAAMNVQGAELVLRGVYQGKDIFVQILIPGRQSVSVLRLFLLMIKRSFPIQPLQPIKFP